MKASLHPTNKRGFFVRGQTRDELDVLADFVDGSHQVTVETEPDPDNGNARILVFTPVPLTAPAKSKASKNASTSG